MSNDDGGNAATDDAMSVKDLADTLLAGTDIEEVARRETRKAIRARVSSMVKTALKTGIDDELKGQLNDVISAVVTESVQAATTPAEDAEPEDDTPDPAAGRDAFLAWVESTLARIETPEKEESRRGWCPQWWDHPEAVDRFHALYMQYLTAAADGALSSWWVDHWDRHSGPLFAQTGIFEQCVTDGHVPQGKRVRILPTEAPPEDWFPYPEEGLAS